ncbi:glycosyltransferase family 61 protein [Vreelandella aquamarina]|uniref:glycosyltransferase family 61 protein n=1 Tax=Vreelandella aquamarina TaxID=77097 RepID=UPI001D196AE8|nr:glycosyltransferase family 61 protein [Halomonas meridiana]MCC4288866.1 glycosyltransferase family 61 protein [Halomonas meridiana]
MLNNIYADVELVDSLIEKKARSIHYVEQSKNQVLDIHQHLHTNEIGFYRAKNIVFNNQVLYDSDGNVLVEYDPLAKEKYFSEDVNNVVKRKNSFIHVFIEPRTKNYFHFYVQTVAALDFIKKNYDCEDQFIWVVGRLSKWKKEILLILNFDMSTIMEINIKESYRFEEILLPSLTFKLIDRIRGVNWATSHPSCYQFRDKVLSNTSKTKLSSELENAKKIYLSRSKIKSHRNLLNESELESVVIKKGYTIVYPEKLSIAEQAVLFNNVDIIIGPSGAAFTNIIFCRKGTRVGVIQPTSLKSTEGGYPVMAGLLGLKPFAYNAAFDGLNIERNGVHDDYSVDIERMENFINHIENGFDVNKKNQLILSGFYKKHKVLNNSSQGMIDRIKKLGKNLQSADIMREVAIFFEDEGDIKTALKLMQKAKELRPTGPFIKAKVEEYKGNLNEKPH